MYYTYMIRCEDDSIYTGITNDLEKRMNDHFNRTKNCAKYTLSHKAKRLETAWKSENKILASKLEYRLKELIKEDKESLVLNNRKFKKLLDGKIDTEEYKRVGKKELDKERRKYINEE